MVQHLDWIINYIQDPFKTLNDNESSTAEVLDVYKTYITR